MLFAHVSRGSSVELKGVENEYSGRPRAIWILFFLRSDNPLPERIRLK